MEYQIHNFDLEGICLQNRWDRCDQQHMDLLEMRDHISHSIDRLYKKCISFRILVRPGLMRCLLDKVMGSLILRGRNYLLCIVEELQFLLLHNKIQGCMVSMSFLLNFLKKLKEDTSSRQVLLSRNNVLRDISFLTPHHWDSLCRIQQNICNLRCKDQSLFLKRLEVEPK